MSLRVSLKGAARAALNALRSLGDTCTYHHVAADSQYDPNTGQTVTPEHSTETGVSIQLSDETRMEPGVTDARKVTMGYIHADDLTTDPRDGDYIVLEDNRRFDVVRIMANNEIVWELELRAKV